MAHPFRIIAILALMTGPVFVCGNVDLARGDPAHAASIQQPLPGPDPRTFVVEACKGSHVTPGACDVCVREAVEALRLRALLTPAEAGRLIASFASGECRDRCISTTCAAEVRNCGTIPSLCGGNLDCGGPCATPGGPEGITCLCNDGTQPFTCGTGACESGHGQTELCLPLCESHGGLTGTGCFPTHPDCP
jgi:hypothetical protein